MRTYLIAAILLLSFLPIGASAQSDISLYVGTAPAGGHHNYALLTQRHAGKHLGAPVVLKSMPGAGGRKAADYLANQARKDGTEIAALFPEVTLVPLMEKATYAITSLVPLGSAARGSQLCVTAPGSRIKTLEDARGGVVLGATSANSPTHAMANIVKNMAMQSNASVKIVSGYASVQTIALAMESGEADMMCGLEYTSLVTIRPQWLDQKANIILQLGPAKNAPVPSFGTVPDIRDFVTPGDLPVVEFIVRPQTMARPYFAPAGVSKERLEFLRKGLAATWRDPDFLAEAKKLKLDIDAVSAEEMQKLIAELGKTPQAIVKRAMSVQ